MKTLLLVVALLLLTGCPQNYSVSKTVWDAQGCAYTLTMQSPEPTALADNWPPKSSGLPYMYIYRDKLSDKSTTCSGVKNVQND